MFQGEKSNFSIERNNKTKKNLLGLRPIKKPSSLIPFSVQHLNISRSYIFFQVFIRPQFFRTYPFFCRFERANREPVCGLMGYKHIKKQILFNGSIRNLGDNSFVCEPTMGNKRKAYRHLHGTRG